MGVELIGWQVKGITQSISTRIIEIGPRLIVHIFSNALSDKTKCVDN